MFPQLNLIWVKIDSYLIAFNMATDKKLTTIPADIPVVNTLTGTCLKMPRDVVCRYRVWEAELDKAAENGSGDLLWY